MLHDGALADWEVHWDQDGTMLAVWTAGKGAGAAGSLSLYPIDPATGRADLDHPLLDEAPAFAGVSLEAGRLVWSAPRAAGNTTVQVLAWSGDSVGRLSCLAAGIDRRPLIPGRPGTIPGSRSRHVDGSSCGPAGPQMDAIDP